MISINPDQLAMLNKQFGLGSNIRNAGSLSQKVTYLFMIAGLILKKLKNAKLR